MMRNAVLDMLKKYKCENTEDYVNALKEIIQEIALLGLYRANFLSRAAFYGGTSLRIIHGLDRFSVKSILLDLIENPNLNKIQTSY